MTERKPSLRKPSEYTEVVIEIGGLVDDHSHAYNSNPEGQTACGLFPDSLSVRRAWRIVPFERCPRCEKAVVS